MRIALLLSAVLATGACAGTLGPAASAQSGQRDPGQLLERSDLNGDGQITRAEYAQARAQLFDRLDRNRDGAINQEDFSGRRLARRGGGGERLRQLAEVMDTNGDGRVTRAEFVDGPAPAFDRGDANGDGVLTANEVAAIRQAMNQRRAQ